ncbi:geranylgeranylglycerol-phosphate geranylgeranyltransferase [Mesonia aquimarina]|uniref:geranylgeranylglycerol-phosphate geranylgeranyltransferase n=1 Tax=Mesonia aquimarina TaxID=1504967 RepID=UPI000EF5CD15|nr:geranylgeranylglycerol-phosphate geranylgeranyltransferase [Mesonia aquimarina]
MKYLKLIQLPEVFLVIFTQYLIKYYLFEPFGIDITLNGFGLFLVSLSSACLVMGSQVISAIFQAKSIQINEPESTIVGKDISEKNAYNFFIVLNVIAVLIGFYLANIIGKPMFSALFIVVSALTYIHASFLKNYAFIDNILLSILGAFSVLALGLFDLLPAITTTNQASQTTIFSILIDYTVFAFLMVLLLELINDQKNVNGDYKIVIKTLPIILGKERTNKIIFILSILPIAAVLYYMYTYLYHNQYALLYVLLLIVAPLLYFMVKIWNASTQKNYKHLAFILKIILFLSVMSIGLYQYILL